MSRIVKCIVTLSIIAAFASFAAAQEPNRGERERRGEPGFFERFATEDMIVLDRLPQDTPPAIREILRLADVDGDGKLTRREFERLRQPPRGDRPAPPREGERPQPPEGERRPQPPQENPAERLFAEFGKDGVIILENLPERMPAQMKEMLKKADADGDGKVTREELEKFRAAQAAQERENPIQRLFAEFGKDGVIILENLPENVPPRVKEMLKNMDADRDGKVTREEVEKFRQPQREERR